MAKKNTKEKILEAALFLYNTKGSDVITVRHIAAEIGISHGNLNYHFRSSKILVRTLFMQMVDQLDNVMAAAASNSTEISVDRIFKNTLAVYSILEKYRFILLDFASIARKDKFIRERYRDTMNERREQIFFTIRAMQSKGLMRTDIPDFVYDNFIRSTLMVSNAWALNHFLREDSPVEGKAETYAKLHFSLFVPYLTKEGLDQFKAGLPS